MAGLTCVVVCPVMCRTEEFGYSDCAVCACVESHGLSVYIGCGYGIDKVATSGSEGERLDCTDFDGTDVWSVWTCDEVMTCSSGWYLAVPKEKGDSAPNKCEKSFHYINGTCPLVHDVDG